MELVGNTVADRFEIVEKLQSGYFGQTWLAVNRESQGYVCLKVCICKCICLLLMGLKSFNYST